MDQERGDVGATGGSARSQATWLDPRAWELKGWVRGAIRILVFLAPVQVTVLAVQAATRMEPRPGTMPADLVWFGGLMALASLTAFAVQQVVRTVAPSTAMLMLSLALHDEAPARFKAALRSGTGKQLANRARSAAPGTHEQRAAVELVRKLDELNRHDRMTRGHTERVRAYSVLLGQEIGLDRRDLDRLSWAALAHDLGKLEVPSEILNKPGRPSPEEWAVLRAHPGAGAAHVEALRPWLGDWVLAATQHHERYDGGGYPAGLAGKDISLAARIVAIADAFDVMTAARSYKKPLPAAQARVELHNNAGTQFDPELVRAFLRISVGRLRWVIGPLGWLSNLPQLVRAPVAGLATGGGAAAAVATSVLMVAPTTTVVEPRVVPAGVAMDQAGDADDLGRVMPPSTTTSTTSTTAPSKGSRLSRAPAGGSSPTSTTTTSHPAAPPSGSPATPTSPTTTAPTAPSAPGSVKAEDDTFTITSTDKTILHVHKNDDYGGFDRASTVIVQAPTKGSATVVGSNLDYRANEGATGSDHLVYETCNTIGSCDRAIVWLTLDLH